MEKEIKIYVVADKDDEVAHAFTNKDEAIDYLVDEIRSDPMEYHYTLKFFLKCYQEYISDEITSLDEPIDFHPLTMREYIHYDWWNIDIGDDDFQFNFYETKLTLPDNIEVKE